MRTRSERRHHHQRMIDKVKNFVWLKSKFWNGSEEKRLAHIKKMAETRKPCSCWMCGNPRKHQKDKKTMQEKRYDERILDDGEN